MTLQARHTQDVVEHNSGKRVGSSTPRPDAGRGLDGEFRPSGRPQEARPRNLCKETSNGKAGNFSASAVQHKRPKETLSQNFSKSK
jgi:hypothetical protein